MKAKIIFLNLQLKGDAKPQTYTGPQIVELVDVITWNDKPAMVCMVDETRQQTCDHFALLDGQGYDSQAKSPGGEPVNDQPPKVLGAVKTVRGIVVITSYCFA